MELDKLRCNQILKNHQLANKIKLDRERKNIAVSRSIYLKKNMGIESRTENKQLKDLRESIALDNYSRNRVHIIETQSRVESIVGFEHNSREQSILKREEEIKVCLRRHEK